MPETAHTHTHRLSTVHGCLRANKGNLVQPHYYDNVPTKCALQFLKYTNKVLLNKGHLVTK